MTAGVYTEANPYWFDVVATAAVSPPEILAVDCLDVDAAAAIELDGVPTASLACLDHNPGTRTTLGITGSTIEFQLHGAQTLDALGWYGTNLSRFGGVLEVLSSWDGTAWTSRASGSVTTGKPDRKSVV